MNSMATNLVENDNPPKWTVKGTRRGKPVLRIVEGNNYEEVVQAASTGRGFMLVTSCVLMTDAEADREAVVRLYASVRKQ
jgi:hypothetical protein